MSDNFGNFAHLDGFVADMISAGHAEIDLVAHVPVRRSYFRSEITNVKTFNPNGTVSCRLLTPSSAPLSKRSASI